MKTTFEDREKKNDKGADNFSDVHGNLKFTSCSDAFHLLCPCFNKVIWRLMGERFIDDRT